MTSGRARGVVKDLAVLVLVFAVILGGVYVYTGTWPPAVIVESQSMMHRHEDVPFGHFGTIDPGDLVLVKRASAPDEIETWADGGRERYGMPGDVIVFHRNNLTRETPIIHRAMAWVDVVPVGEGREYHVRWNPDAECPRDATRSGSVCVFGRDGVTSVDLGVRDYRPERSGFITKGDNPFSNPRADQVTTLSAIVEPGWIQGKARGEVPWLGLLKLALAPTINEPNPGEDWVRVGNAYAPRDLWVMLGVTLVVLVAIPAGYDVIASWRRQRREE